LYSACSSWREAEEREMAKLWMVRAGEGGYLIEDFEKAACVAVGWVEMKDLSKVQSEEELEAEFDRAYPHEKRTARPQSLAGIGKFRFVMQKGDAVISYDPEKREYLYGQIVGDYSYEPGRVPDYAHVRSVDWKGHVSRDDLSPGARSTLSPWQTITQPKQEVHEEVVSLLHGEKGIVKAEEAQEEAEDIYLNLREKAFEFTKDMISKLSWDEMQQLVAALLRAMGYKTEVSPGGADRGKDIIASPDGLGLEQPRIKVEVKHRLREQMSASAVRSFMAALQPSDRGLYVSTGGFSKEARYEAERSAIPVTLIDLDRLARLFVDNYAKVDSEGRGLVALTPILWPAS